VPRANRYKTVLTANGKKVGRARKQPPRDVEKRAEVAAATGASLIAVARSMGVSYDVFARWMEENPDIREAIMRGRETEREVLHSGLVQAAQKGNIIAAIFLLKSRHGYREGDQGETSNRVAITFNLPGALKPEQFIIENEPSSEPQRLSATRTSRS